MSHPLYGEWPEALKEGALKGDLSPMYAFADWLNDNGLYGHEEVIRHNIEDKAFPGQRIGGAGMVFNPRHPDNPMASTRKSDDNRVRLRIPTANGQILSYRSKPLLFRQRNALFKSVKQEQDEHYNEGE